jgi:hypothetical protein
MTDAKQTQPPTSSNDPGFIEMLNDNYTKASEAAAVKRAGILRGQINDIDRQLVVASNISRNFVDVSSIDGYYVNDLQRHYDKLGFQTTINTKNYTKSLEIKFMA